MLKIFTKWQQYVYILFTPANKLTIRNIPREFVDRDERMLHANFSILCDFIELEYDGVEKFENLINAEIAEIEKLEMNLASKNMELAYDEDRERNYIKSRKEGLKVDQTLLSLYNWYNDINWKDSVPETEEYKEAMDKVEYQSAPVAGSPGMHTMQRTGDPKDIAKVMELSIEHSEREDAFERICQKNLELLIKHRNVLWT